MSFYGIVDTSESFATDPINFRLLKAIERMQPRRAPDVIGVIREIRLNAPPTTLQQRQTDHAITRAAIH